MALETSLANIVIKNNTIDHGRSSDGTSPATYNYAHNAWIYGSALIDGNTFMSPAASADMLNIDNCSCTITNNKFIRSSTSINSYIRNYGTNDQKIVGNIFDTSTTNGTSEDLVLGLSITSAYHSNKNQIAYTAIPYGAFSNNPDSTLSIFITTGVDGVAIPDRSFTILSALGTGEIQFASNMDFNIALPENVKILDAKVGFFAINSGATIIDESSVELSLNAQDLVTANYSTGVNSILDPKNRISSSLETITATPYDIDVNLSAVTTDSQYLPIDSSSSSNFTTHKNISITGQIAVKLNISVIGSGFILQLSPLVVRYRYL